MRWIVDKEQLVEILADHAKWLSGQGGSRADLRDANLSRVDLRDASLRRAALSGAGLSHNDYVIGCTLTNYPLVAFMEDNELCVTSGCRRGLTIAEAREYWSPSNKEKWTEKDESWGAQRLRMIDFLEAEAKHLGWIK